MEKPNQDWTAQSRRVGAYSVERMLSVRQMHGGVSSRNDYGRAPRANDARSPSWQYLRNCASRFYLALPLLLDVFRALSQIG